MEAKPTSNHHHPLSTAPCASFGFWTLCEGSGAFPAFCSKCGMSWEHKHRFSPPPTNAFYPMTSQDTMRPFCLFSQIRVRSHTNTNINILSSEWATKYLVGNSHESVFARFVMIYCEPKRTALHALLCWPETWRSWCFAVFVIKCIKLVGHRWEQGCSCPKVPLWALGACAVAYKCHKIATAERIRCRYLWLFSICFETEMEGGTHLSQTNWQNYFISTAERYS